VVEGGAKKSRYENLPESAVEAHLHEDHSSAGTSIKRAIGKWAFAARISAADAVARARNPLLPPRQLRMHVGGNFQKVGTESVRRFVELGGLKPDDRVLDIGCGVGRIAIPLMDYLDDSARYEGFDVDSEMISWAQSKISRRRPSFRFQHVDLETDMYNAGGSSSAETFRFPYEDDSFLFAFATSVFTHLYPKETLNYINEARRVLAPGGSFYSTWFLIHEDETDLTSGSAGLTDSKHRRAFVQRGDHWTTRPGDDRQQIGISESKAVEMMTGAGIEVTAIYDGSWSGRVGAMGARQDIIIGRVG
jgi:ubiquinone/menaquinone biosynthesis C-methylase UbiE